MTAEKVRSSTYSDLIDKLNEFKKCCLIRPTGFGKTWMLTDLISCYQRVLYVYPTAAILNTVVDAYYNSEDKEISDPETIELAKEMKSFENVDMMTYMKLQSLTRTDVKELPEYNLIIFDEAHIMGAKGASKVIKQIFNRLESTAHIIGATATPNRMDGFDIVSEFFNNVVVFPYTLHDAFQDKLLQRPNYYYCTHEPKEQVKNAIIDANEQFLSAGLSKEATQRKELYSLMKSYILHEANIWNMENIIREGITKYLRGTYFKFICFFNTVNYLKENGKNVKKWFQDAFPDYTINILPIHSGSEETLKNVNKLDSLTAKPKTIDLIFCVNMVSVGYHVSNLSGILMYRCTRSNIVYIQQLGRALSSGSSQSCLVFDVVDNLHRKALYEMKTKRIRNSHIVKPTPAVLRQLSEEAVAKLNTQSLRCRIEEHGGEYVVLANDEYYDSIDQSIKVSWWSKPIVEREDLLATGQEATYKELITKAVAEPISHLCREAVELHFKRWCRDNRIKYPISRKDVKLLYGVPETEWRNNFKEILETEGLQYPWQDASKIMNCASVPLDVFAREKSVSIPRILELLGV